MQQIVTGAEMQELEKKVFARLGLSPLLVMENAGSRIVETLKVEYGCLRGRRIHILVGTGNNGGDGLVAARQLLALGARVKIYLVGDQQKLTKENRTNLEILRKLKADFSVVDISQNGKLKFSLGMADLIIDAIFGTGFSGTLDADLESLVALVNEIKRPLVAIDCPTGVNAANGAVNTTAIQADLTINLGLLKTGCVLYPGAAYAGRNIVVDLGFPLVEQGITRLVLGEDILDWLPAREPWGHKGTFGHTLVVAGSPNYAGAASLSAQAVLRGGGGYVTVAVPRGIYDRFRPDELIVVPVAQTDQGTIGKASLQELLTLAKHKNVLAIGPGLTQFPEVTQVVQELLDQWDGPCVIDADALVALTPAFLKSVPEAKRSNWIVTPHPGEMARLVGSEARAVDANRLGVAEELARQWNLVVVLKGAPTIVACNKETYINSTGNSGMATAGSGDLLTGLIASLLSQGLAPLKAAALGVYVHGRAGDAAGLRGQRGLKAGDMLLAIQEILS
ncbi:MAG TPA: bifunctional ADP-dependent NAD(P)H-hydrate dehydratase/NAD(P)H-hydrate epimerase [Firmicutes bacterium]|nr:bifunctional ADP-dependent NAD(P)H-hydrate dehydratase/NAD(P)H-hydrate epimerase [Bacillota bacterium]